MNSDTSPLPRRAFLRRGGAALAGLAGGALLPLAGCSNSGNETGGRTSSPAKPAAEPTGSTTEVRLVAEEIEVNLGPHGRWRTWGYNGRYPGPEIRVPEGERLRVRVENQLPSAGTTVHWHGLPVPNAMDGVPGVTQEPIPPGGSMTYEYLARPAGSYMYHSHQNLQLDRGLIGPLIIEERTPHVEYDRDHTLIIDDLLPGEPRSLNQLASEQDGGDRMDGMMNGRGRMGDMMDRGRGGGRRGMMGGGGIVPPYEHVLINGHSAADPAALEVRQGERARFRLVNLSSALTYEVALAGHRLTVSHADGHPVEPVEVDSLVIGMGERYDVIVEADQPGAHTLMARPLNADVAPGRATVRYPESRRSRPPENEVPEGLRGGRRLHYRDLRSLETLPSQGTPDQVYDLRLSGGMMMQPPGVWTIDGQQYPDADPLPIREGQRIRINMTNMSMMQHPMHLHGHFFRVGDALKETVLVEPHMGRASFEFVADNPGDWIFHCHNLYHLDGGMARLFTYR